MCKREGRPELISSSPSNQLSSVQPNGGAAKQPASHSLLAVLPQQRQTIDYWILVRRDIANDLRPICYSRQLVVSSTPPVSLLNQGLEIP